MAFSPPVHETDLSAGVCISAPEGGAYPAAADRLRKSLEGVLSAPVEVLPDGELDADGRHVIALGNMMDSAYLRALYFRAYDLTDRAWPGPGGWAVRTAPHTLEGVGHTVVVGASCGEDIGGGVEALCGAIEGGGGVLAYQHRVELGRWSDLYLGPAQERLEKGDAELERETIGGGSGDWDYEIAVAHIGMLAVQTGMVELMEMFCRQICNFVRVRWFERTLEEPPQIHGFVRALLLPFAMVENHPGISRAGREEALEALLAIYRSREGAGNTGFLSQVGVDRVRQNHQTRSALDLYYGGRYFSQVHGLAEGLAWMKLVDLFFIPQMASNKPVCDSWGHQWAASLFNTADYALASGRMDYFSSRPFLEGVDRALIAHSNLEGGPRQYFLMAAAATGNDEYLALCRTEDEDGLVRRAVRTHEEPLRTWMTGRAAAAPERLGRVGVAPLSRLFYDSIEEYPSFAPEGVYLRNVPYEQTFDKLFFRSGWTVEDDYLLLDGISGGSHSYQDGNCIVRFTSRGQNWFGGRVGPASVREHVGVNIAVDGAGPGRESRYAALRYVGEGEGMSAAGTCMEYPGQGDWCRHIVHGEAGWFLVVDEVWAQVAGEFLVEGRWHVLGEVALADGVLRSTQGGARLTMRHAGSGAQDLVPMASAREKGGVQWVQRSLTGLRQEEGVRFATLFWADRGEKDFELVAEASGYRVQGEGQGVRILMGAGGESPAFEAECAALPGRDGVVDASAAAPFQVRAGDMAPAWSSAYGGAVTAAGRLGSGCCVGDADGGVEAFDRAGRALWRAGISGAVRAIAALADGGAVAGGDGERVCRLDASGREVWSCRIEWQPMNWDSWSRKHCAVLSLAAGDIDGDGEEEVLAGCADRHLYAFDSGGRLLWRSGCQWGPPVCVAVARLEEGPERQALAGMADPAIHGCTRVYGADGRLAGTLQRPDIVSWSIPSWSKCLRVADLNGDGWEDVISGVDTNHRQLIVYRRDGAVLWDADMGGAVLVIEAAGERVFAGAANGFVQCFDAGGRRLWSRFAVAPAVGLAPDGAGGCLAALKDGTVLALDGNGEVRGAGRGSADATVSAWVEGGLLVGRTDGTVDCYLAD